MITWVTPDGITVIKADEGKWLQKGEAYSNTDIYLGKNDLPANWTEILTEPIPPADEVESTIAELEGLI